MKNINRKHGRASTKRNLDANLDKLFDISACSCSLDILPCSDRKVSCNKANYLEEHISCICSQNAKVPLNDRVYLRDQRQKTGPKGAYNLSSVDRVAFKKKQED